MISFASRLPEIDLRAYAAVEAYRLGYGGVTVISKLLGIHPATIKRGLRDLDDPSRLPDKGRIRGTGAGRPTICEAQPGLEAAFDELIESHIAGDPMNADIKWTDLHATDIEKKLQEAGF